MADIDNNSAAEEKPKVKVVPCKYKTGRVLGQGTYATVKEAIHIDTHQFFAIKVINKKLMAGREHMVRNEIAVLKRVSQGHDAILTLVDYFETANNLYLVTDLCHGGELFDRIYRKGSYFESDARKIVQVTLDGVLYLHDNGIVHRDLKPENLLFRTPAEDSDLLIADFGLSRIIDEEKLYVLTTTCGTPGYMAPEIFKKTGHGRAVDIWAMGVITYFLLCGYAPFDRDTGAMDEMQAIMAGEFSFDPEYWDTVSDNAKDFICKCLTVNPANRMTAVEALAHPWLSQRPEDETDLLPVVRQNFNARRTFQTAVDAVMAINSLKDGLTMEGALSHSPEDQKSNWPTDKNVSPMKMGDPDSEISQ